MEWSRGRGAALALGFAAVAAAGCGSGSHSLSRIPAPAATVAAPPSTPSTKTGTTASGPPLSLSVYEQQGAAALKPALQAELAVKSNIQDAANWDQLERAFSQASAAFGQMAPPAAAASLNGQLSSDLSALATQSRNVGADLRKRAETAAQTDLQGWKAALGKYQQVIAQLKVRGIRFIASS